MPKYRVSNCERHIFEVETDFIPEDPRNGFLWQPLFDQICAKYENDKSVFVGVLGLGGTFIEVLNEQGQIDTVWAFVDTTEAIRLNRDWDSADTKEFDMSLLRPLNSLARTILINRVFHGTRESMNVPSNDNW